MIVQTIVFGAVLAFVPAVGLVAIWCSAKQRRIANERAHHTAR